ncbi:hypothetical protein CYLTODRAFT_493393, partial [Cylindrobasidium torrendii FP15055 ss-10]
MLRRLWLLSALSAVCAQTCENAGYADVTTGECECPTGFGGTNCAQPACGGTIFDGQNRTLANTQTNGFANITGCACEEGWTGLGCNVCSTSSACSRGYSSVANSDNAGVSGQNTTMTCNTAPRVWAAGQMSCSVVNPTLQAVFPLSSFLNIERTVDSSLSALSNVTSFGPKSTVFAQLFYGGVEQFYCSADSCTQTDDGGASSWNCNNLSCHCRNGTSMCGGSPMAITSTINGLGGTLGIDCDAVQDGETTAKCAFKQETLQGLFGSDGLALQGCSFGECVRQFVIDNANSTSTTTATTGSSLSGGVIAGLAILGAIVLFSLGSLLLCLLNQRKARRSATGHLQRGGIGITWRNINYTVSPSFSLFRRHGGKAEGYSDDKVILDSISGQVQPGQFMAILGPSGAGKTTLVDILAQKNMSGTLIGSVTFPGADRPPRVGFVPQQDILPPMLTVFETLLFSARLRLPDAILDAEKVEAVEQLIDQLGLRRVRDTRIGDGITRGISGGEMRRVSIGLELIARPDILILDEPSSGLDSVSASKVAKLLHDIAHNPEYPTAVISSIHQPSSQLYQTFDKVLVLAHGNIIYDGPGGLAPVEHLSRFGESVIPFPGQGYNVADYLLDVASEPPLVLLGRNNSAGSSSIEKGDKPQAISKESEGSGRASTGCPTTFLTQLECLCGREWKVLNRDKTLFIAHLAISCILGLFCGGLYYQTGLTIAGFQSRVGCLFFLGALIAFSSLSALYSITTIRPLFMRERSGAYYSPLPWLIARVLFDVLPLRIIPMLVVSTITYWMAGLAHDAANFFKFLLILALYTLALTLYNFLLGAVFSNAGLAILLSALSALFQMTFAGFFVHLNTIPHVLRWLQWVCPLKYSLEALSVNEVGSGLMIVDQLEGVPVNVSAVLIMETLFGFKGNAYYRDVLILAAFSIAFGLGLISVVYLRLRERR